MEKYKNLSGESGIHAYEIGNDFIIIKFNDGSVYTYNYSVTGLENIEKMKILAIAGQGLNSYINRFVKKGYVSRRKE